MYTNSWDPNNGAILRSTDRGATWQVDRAAVQGRRQHARPRHGRAARRRPEPQQHPLLRRAEAATACGAAPTPAPPGRKVTSFPNAGNYVAGPRRHQRLPQRQPGRGVGDLRQAHRHRAATPPRPSTSAWPTRRTPSTAPPTAAPRWERVAGQPTGYLAAQGRARPVSGILYIATSDTGGPYDGGQGRRVEVRHRHRRLDPDQPDPVEQRRRLLRLQRPDHRPAEPEHASWWPPRSPGGRTSIFFRSTDGGATWTRIWDFDQLPQPQLPLHAWTSRAAPWLTFGANPQPPEVTPKLGWMTESLEIDPFNSNRMMYGTGATIYGTTNLTNWDTGGTDHHHGRWSRAWRRPRCST